MEPRELKVGEIVQIDPAHNDGRDGRCFGGCLMIITEPKPWGAQGYVQNAGADGPAFYRCKFEHMEPTGGMAPWMREGMTLDALALQPRLRILFSDEVKTTKIPYAGSIPARIFKPER